MSHKENKNMGSTFDSFLREEKTLSELTSLLVKLIQTSRASLDKGSPQIILVGLSLL